MSTPPDNAGRRAQTLLVATAQTPIGRIAAAAQGLQGGWLYLGDDYLRLKAVEAGLPSGLSRIDAAPLLEQVASDLRARFNDWIDALNRDDGQDMAWLLSGAASRNTYISGIFHNICGLELVLRLARGGNAPAVVVTQSPALAEALAEAMGAGAIAVRREIAEAEPGWLDTLFELWPLWKRTAKTLWRRHRAFRKHQARLSPPPKHEPLVLVDTFLHRDSFEQGKPYCDRYHPGLRQYLAEHGHKVLIHFTPIDIDDWDGLYGRMAASDAMFLCPEAHLRPGDYLAALLQPLRLHLLHSRRMPARFGELNVARLWREEFQRTRETGILPTLIHRLLLRLAKSGVRIAHAIDWCENQPIDKALAAGIHQGHPGALVYGAQMFFHSPNCPGLFPTPAELQAGLSPDVLLATGTSQQLLAQAHAPLLPCRVAAALRHLHVFQPTTEGSGGRPKPSRILVLLPNMLADALELVDKVSAILPDIPAQLRVVAKIHPDCDPEDLLNLHGRETWPKRLELQGGPMSAFTAGTAAAIASGTSSAIEIAALGIPVLLWARTATLSMDVDIGRETPLLTRCHGAAQAVEFMARSLGKPERAEALRAEGIFLRGFCFTPVRPETMAAYLPEGTKDAAQPFRAR